MRKATYIALFVLLLSLTLVSMDTRSFCWNLLDLFNDTVYSEEGLQKAIEYEPNMDHFFLPSIEGKDLFASIDDLSICRREEVRRYLYMYLTVGREYVKNSIHRSYMYMEIIEDVMEEYPEITRDMALLPLLESGFNPRAVSKSRAVGLWQFMYPTSQMLGLKINNWVDERRHIEKSTRAALRHLKNLYSIYGSWELSLAAYNGGAGHVSRTMKRTGIRDYWK
ncbi:MAG TPA: lytic transglycosylase domain-containing protein, partial [Spirochaetota bacterium]|nr:lytic transglycosylase domain-containing protein [Spirochaetota bacterium]